MGRQVLLQIIHLNEPSATNLAHERPLPGVNPHVDRQLPFAHERSRTQLAPVRPFLRVGGHLVALPVRRVRVPILAEPTLEGLFAGVATNVQRKTLLGFEAGLAVRTVPDADLPVAALVDLVEN